MGVLTFASVGALIFLKKVWLEEFPRTKVKAALGCAVYSIKAILEINLKFSIVLIWKIQGVNARQRQLQGGFWKCLGFLNSTSLHEIISLLKIL